MIHLNAGHLTQRLTLQSASESIDALGQRVETWADVATVWAQAMPLRGSEYFAAGQVQSVVDVRFRIRWRDDVTPAMRAVWRSVAHDIVSVIDVGGAKVALELMCASGRKDGR